MTNDIGSILYTSPEQDEGGYISFGTDIYFLYEKQDFYSINPYDKASSQSKKRLSSKTSIPVNFQNLYKC